MSNDTQFNNTPSSENFVQENFLFSRFQRQLEFVVE
jgi:hypothetical protein